MNYIGLNTPQGWQVIYGEWVATVQTEAEVYTAVKEDREMRKEGANIMEQPIPEGFYLASRLAYNKAQAEGYANISEYPGIISVECGKWKIEMHGSKEDIDDLPMATVRVTYNGWPAGFVNAAGGIIAAGAAANEDTFIEALKEALA